MRCALFRSGKNLTARQFVTGPLCLKATRFFVPPARRARLSAVYGSTCQVDKQSHMVLVLMIQLMPNGTNTQQKLYSLVCQSLLK